MGRTTGKYEIGTIHKTKKHGDIIITGKLADNLRRMVMFINTNVVKETSLSAIFSGSLLDPSRGKYSVGRVYPTINSGYIRITKRLGNDRREITFEETGKTQNVHISAIDSGYIGNSLLYEEELIINICKDLKFTNLTQETISKRYGVARTTVTHINKNSTHSYIVEEFMYPHESSIRKSTKPYDSRTSICRIKKVNYGLGTIHKTKRSGDIEIIEVLEGKKRKVKFIKSNVEKITTIESINRGSVLDPTASKYAVGTIHETNCNGPLEVIGYISASRRMVKLLDTNKIRNVAVSSIMQGRIGTPAKTDEVVVEKICKELKYGLKTQVEIAEMFNIGKTTVSNINKCRFFPHVTMKYKHEFEKKIRGSFKTQEEVENERD